MIFYFKARAQGLVVLQQWGDKQVLVHKATGRWIMRQGNKLVTVPPQVCNLCFLLANCH